MIVSNEQYLMGSQVYAAGLKDKIYSYRDQERIRNGWLKKRLKTVLPMVMKRCGIDVWVVCCKEYNEDPVLTTLVAAVVVTIPLTVVICFPANASSGSR